MEDHLFWIFWATIGLRITYFVSWAMWREDFDGCRSQWEHQEELKIRQPMSPEEFYAEYYRSSGIAKELVVRLLEINARCFGEQVEMIRPMDDFFRIHAGLDASEWFEEVKQELCITITDEDSRSVPDGSFDTQVRLIDRRLREVMTQR